MSYSPLRPLPQSFSPSSFQYVVGGWVGGREGEEGGLQAAAAGILAWASAVRTPAEGGLHCFHYLALSLKPLGGIS